MFAWWGKRQCRKGNHKLTDWKTIQVIPIHKRGTMHGQKGEKDYDLLMQKGHCERDGCEHEEFRKIRKDEVTSK